jgi:hypothetical protein
MSSDTERAWAAGFFDGEGSVGKTFAKNGRPGVPQVSITQAGIDGIPDTLLRFCAAVGVEPSRIYGPIDIAHRKPRYQLQINAYESVLAVRDALWPWLSSAKRAAFTARLDEYEVKRADRWPRSLPWTHCKQGHPMTEDNVYVSQGGRSCRTCQRERSRLQAERKRRARATT